ncbi:Uma2 family endonuclease [Nocardioides humilatus]|nr:Uma2 family endonuclease [Nocardioides humilatus]
MSWEQYLTYDDAVPSEYYGGALVVAAQPSQLHQHIQFRLTTLLHAHAPAGAAVTQGWAWSPDGAREELGPDLMVHEPTTEQRALRSIPFLVVEIVSTNRSADLVAKLQRYAAWGAPSYWIVDPRDHAVTTLVLRDGLYEESGFHTSGAVVLTYGDIEVPVDLDALFG